MPEFVIRYALREYGSLHFTQVSARTARDAAMQIIDNLGVHPKEIEAVFLITDKGEWERDLSSERSTKER